MTALQNLPPSSELKLTYPHNDFALSVTAALATRTLTYPVNTIMYRIQNAPVVNIRTLNKVIFADAYNKHFHHRFYSLYNGYGVKLLERTIKRAAKLFFQPLIQDGLNARYGKANELYMGKSAANVFSAAISGGVIGCLLVPFYPLEHTTTKTRLGFDSRYSWDIVRQENWGLYRGSTMVLLRNIPRYAIPFAIVAATEEHSFAAAFISSILNIICTGPQSTILGRMQECGESAIVAARRIAAGGFYGFYRGTGITLFANGVKQILPIIAAAKMRRKMESHSP